MSQRGTLPGAGSILGERHFGSFGSFGCPPPRRRQRLPRDGRMARAPGRLPLWQRANDQRAEPFSLVDIRGLNSRRKTVVVRLRRTDHCSSRHGIGSRGCRGHGRNGRRREDGSPAAQHRQTPVGGPGQIGAWRRGSSRSRGPQDRAPAPMHHGCSENSFCCF